MLDLQRGFAIVRHNLFLSLFFCLFSLFYIHLYSKLGFVLLRLTFFFFAYIFSPHPAQQMKVSAHISLGASIMCNRNRRERRTKLLQACYSKWVSHSAHVVRRRDILKRVIFRFYTKKITKYFFLWQAVVHEHQDRVHRERGATRMEARSANRVQRQLLLQWRRIVVYKTLVRRVVGSLLGGGEEWSETGKRSIKRSTSFGYRLLRISMLRRCWLVWVRTSLVSGRHARERTREVAYRGRRIRMRGAYALMARCLSIWSTTTQRRGRVKSLVFKRMIRKKSDTLHRTWSKWRRSTSLETQQRDSLIRMCRRHQCTQPLRHALLTWRRKAMHVHVSKFDQATSMIETISIMARNRIAKKKRREILLSCLTGWWKVWRTSMKDGKTMLRMATILSSFLLRRDQVSLQLEGRLSWMKWKLQWNNSSKG